ncbi:hypothetical protein BD410DRAFT_902599 [Rickenella mellea]|uniref:Uncharacterized protein n=1 Tax=Rickenella mellea TaxID=50990 RepID=A0A4Y7PJL7_9AGAM|nr:hypothetical protein BD410DRAFT_902599 [Rickenella mellea]
MDRLGFSAVGTTTIAKARHCILNADESNFAREKLGSQNAFECGLVRDGRDGEMENAASDAIKKVMANPDVQDAADKVRAGA